jgi:hypothetical protein
MAGTVQRLSFSEEWFINISYPATGFFYSAKMPRIFIPGRTPE